MIILSYICGSIRANVRSKLCQTLLPRAIQVISVKYTQTVSIVIDICSISFPSYPNINGSVRFVECHYCGPKGKTLRKMTKFMLFPQELNLAPFNALCGTLKIICYRELLSRELFIIIPCRFPAGQLLRFTGESYTFHSLLSQFYMDLARSHVPSLTFNSASELFKSREYVHFIKSEVLFFNQFHQSKLS